MLSIVALAALSCGASPTVNPISVAFATTSGDIATGVVTEVRSRVLDPELEALWAKGVTLDAWIAAAERRRAVWERNAAAARLPRDVAERLNALEGSGPWRLLVVAADWCLDSAYNVPAIARLALYSDALDLRIVSPDQGGQTVMEARRTPDGRAATPTLVILGPEGDEVGCWVERPARQRAFYDENLKGVEEGTEEYNAAVRDFLGWYASDNGASTLRELVTTLEESADGARGCSRTVG